MPESFHRRGHHVQKAHGRRAHFAADGSHLSGAMIALMPTAADARRLALPGGEKAADLHCTLLFLGDDGEAWPVEVRDAMEAAAVKAASELTPVLAKVFGVAHWNGNGDNPSWVWNVGDDPDRGLADSTLHEVHHTVGDILGMCMAMCDGEMPEPPQQHSPWAAHICAAYTDDLTLARTLEKRLGPVTFDRIRLSFGDDDRDIPLTARSVSLTASALRRDPEDHEEFCDFAEHNRQWEGAVQTATGRMISVYAGWRTWIAEQIKAGADTPEEWASITLGPDQGIDQAAEVLHEAMTSLALRAGQALAREAEKQGVKIPEWNLPDDTVTAAVGGRRLLSSVARMTADLLATSVVQTAKRTVTGLFTRQAPPDQVAAEVDRALTEAQDSLLRGPVGTAMSTAQTAGRQAVLEAAPPGEYYASEILDRNTCAPCKAVDGEQFSSLEIAIKAYPVMGYKDCVGPKYGHPCRGMIVARWTPEAEPVTASAEEFHGSLGDPDYHAKHPGNRGKGLRRLPPPRGGMVGSPDYTEAEHEAALSAYIDNPDVNVFLRKGEGSGGREPADLKEEARVLNDLIQIQDPLEEPRTVYRGGNKLPPMEVGDEFTDRGFSSTSEDESTAGIFAMAPIMRGEPEKGDVLEITIPAGARALEVYSVYPHGAEDEVILPPGTTFRVTGITDDGYEVEVVVDE